MPGVGIATISREDFKNSKGTLGKCLLQAPCFTDEDLRLREGRLLAQMTPLAHGGASPSCSRPAPTTTQGAGFSYPPIWPLIICLQNLPVQRLNHPSCLLFILPGASSMSPVMGRTWGQTSDKTCSFLQGAPIRIPHGVSLFAPFSLQKWS